MKGLLHHIELYVTNLERSAEFWGWLLEELGYTLYQDWPEGKSWKLDETYLVFVQTEERFLDVPYHRCRTGLNHLAFHAESKEHVDRITAQLKTRNARILYPERHPLAGGESHYAVYIEDPDRIKVEIVAPAGRGESDIYYFEN